MDSASASSVQAYQESNTIKLEWTLRGLKALFESSKGEAKSKVTKSVRFGGGKWQVLFYANSGTVNADGHGFISLYLACEPTAAEKEDAIDGKWVRQGVYRFGFELRNLQRTLVFNCKEAHDHSFSHSTQNWGWAQFARRDLVYFQTNSVRQQDALLIICNITSSPSPPAALPAIPRQPVPRDLLDAMGGLLDDPVYSDVEFILPRRGRSLKDARRIYAARALLQRVPYFHSMFHSGFAEAAPSDETAADLPPSPEPHTVAHFLDSDDEDDGIDADEDAETGDDSSDTTEVTEPPERDSDDTSTHKGWSVVPPDAHEDAELRTAGGNQIGGMASELSSPMSAASSMFDATREDADHVGERAVARHVHAETSHPSSLRAGREEFMRIDSASESSAFSVTTASTSPATHVDVGTRMAHERLSKSSEKHQADALVPGPRKTRVLVRDVPYATYRAVLYYIYTDAITFAPLASSFGHATSPESDGTTDTRPRSRKEWLAQWEERHALADAPRHKPKPCSAKAVYRLADRLDLPELKARAFRHIVRSLSVENVVYEVFSPFAAAFADVRKVMIRYFLDNWAAIRGSGAMRSVWAQIRLGRHPGFEEVWPVIALNLEYHARPGDGEGGQEVGEGGPVAAGAVVHEGDAA
ncbi:hypothetical protein OBBRIDRAFT_870806 [Obba rivulosa]|uniref:MATH domain-containing protein n=1 Tax=Obba rivulosa TaxID=1052685 RepID=A0A8E2B0Z7_9APHY|nr:hypothetical protein OBBRIDRAFT_870806 [Obba rivulosa]